MADPIITVNNVSKAYGGVKALKSRLREPH